MQPPAARRLLFVLQMNVIRSYETSVHIRTTRRYIPEDVRTSNPTKVIGRTVPRNNF
jgi:hypothetical protein